jgi:hypothetical protein
MELTLPSRKEAEQANLLGLLHRQDDRRARTGHRKGTAQLIAFQEVISSSIYVTRSTYK